MTDDDRKFMQMVPSTASFLVSVPQIREMLISPGRSSVNGTLVDRLVEMDNDGGMGRRLRLLWWIEMNNTRRTWINAYGSLRSRPGGSLTLQRLAKLKLLKGQYVQGGAEKSAPPFFYV